MNIQDLSTQLIFTTVPIWVEGESGRTTTGTGFFYNKKINEQTSVPFIVTNAHVVSGATKGFISLIRKEGDKPNLINKITIEVQGNILTQYVNDENDLAAIPVGPFLNQLNQDSIEVFYRSIDSQLEPSNEVLNDLSAVEDITFVGYPSGIYDRKNNIPVVRRGITATPVWNDFDGKPIFLIDAGVYPGSSGSPVLIINSGSYSTKNGIVVGNRVLFLGIVSSTMTRAEQAGNVYLGLGQVIRYNVLKSFIDEITSNLDI